MILIDIQDCRGIGAPAPQAAGSAGGGGSSNEGLDNQVEAPGGGSAAPAAHLQIRGLELKECMVISPVVVESIMEQPQKH